MGGGKSNGAAASNFSSRQSLESNQLPVQNANVQMYGSSTINGGLSNIQLNNGMGLTSNTNQGFTGRSRKDRGVGNANSSLPQQSNFATGPSVNLSGNNLMGHFQINANNAGQTIVSER